MGGSTPNSISYKYIEKITNTLKDNFEFSDNYEMAIECNPAHLEFRHIELLKKFGFNRISVGIQDFRDDVLEAINRRPSKGPLKTLFQKYLTKVFQELILIWYMDCLYKQLKVLGILLIGQLNLILIG